MLHVLCSILHFHYFVFFSNAMLSTGDRDRYCELIMSLMKPGCKYIVETFEYDEQHHSGQLPFNIDKSTLLRLFGEKCNVASWQSVIGWSLEESTLPKNLTLVYHACMRFS